MRKNQLPFSPLSRQNLSSVQPSSDNFQGFFLSLSSSQLQSLLGAVVHSTSAIITHDLRLIVHTLATSRVPSASLCMP